MGFSPWYKGDTYPALEIPLNVEGNPDNISSLSTANLVMILRNTNVAPPVDTTGTGTFTILTASPAVITYQFSSADVASVWAGSLIVKATFPGTGGGVAVYDGIPFSVTDD